VTGGGKQPLNEADRGLVEEGIREWLAANEDDPEVDFLLRSWLKAGLPYRAVAKPAEAWLLKFGESPEAVYFWKEALKQKEVPAPVVRVALGWCRRNPHAAGDDALWRLAQCRRFLAHSELAGAYCEAAESLLALPPDHFVDFRLAKVIQTALVAYLSAVGVESGKWRRV
jgi:hypothetical protein